MEDKILQQLDRIERYSIIAAKQVLTLEEVAFFRHSCKYPWLIFVV